jgi:hypothetical protein
VIIPIENNDDDFFPVDPFLTLDGDLAVLALDLGQGNARPLPLSDAPALLARAKVGQLTLNEAAKVTAGGIFSGALNFEDQAFYYDVMLKSDTLVDEKNASGVAVVGTRWGAGIRVMIRAFDISSKVQLNVYNIGAAVELGECKALYQFIQYGLEALPAMAKLLGEFGEVGRIDMRTLSALRASASDAFKPIVDACDKGGAREIRDTLVPVAVKLNRPMRNDDLLNARKALFVLRSIARGKLTFDEISRRINGDPVGHEIWQIYVGAERNDQPTVEARRNARAVLKVLGVS